MDNEHFFSKQLKQRKENITHEILIAAYREGNLPIPQIHWHLSETEIDLSLQRDALHPRLLVEGFTIIPNVDIETLFNQMTEADAAMFRRRELYNSSFNARTISSVLHSWLKDQKLIPPTIIVYDKEFADTLKIKIITSNELRPIDGKHRINVSYFFGAKSIPILVRNKQLQLIEKKSTCSFWNFCNP